MKEFVLLIALSLLLIYTMLEGIDKTERVECYKWQRYAKEFPNFYLTDWQKAQCDAHGIRVF